MRTESQKYAEVFEIQRWVDATKSNARFTGTCDAATLGSTKETNETNGTNETSYSKSSGSLSEISSQSGWNENHPARWEAE
jgi:hypothetical protein